MTKAYYPESGNQIRIDANLLGPCGFYCGYCLAFKEKRCLGCRYQAKKSEETGIVNVFCDTLACAASRGHTMCSSCEEHPCDKYDPDKSIFSKSYVDYLRDKKR